jgi:hypothetical protein
MESRGRREKKARVDTKALDALEKARLGVAKRSDQVQVNDALKKWGLVAWSILLI